MLSFCGPVFLFAELSHVDLEVSNVGGKLVSENSSFNTRGPTCCYPRGPCHRWPPDSSLQKVQERRRTCVRDETLLSKFVTFNSSSSELFILIQRAERSSHPRRSQSRCFFFPQLMKLGFLPHLSIVLVLKINDVIYL